ncbi:unnamed protein product [Tilletia controversa]|uniref:RRM domain-containing protein n=3 Tax=Tilletia TaxID=13289 RepID=A0A8X7SYV9_9BASI|nr:hypothetical protein CF336_g1942 [Tilletia laevis]KAE8203137.1 hypothetical protein CF328_g1814 [Tilletia controversa]KAE8264745.1 hypothetical protein A4X03_0g734 [Tilletia caries]KAE8207313.1 hypothetical protein CF335_g1227 [Tilletia laevis]KAE8252259.1 hypothetical protein A4X06_0g2322 [Tilletia controversa]
MALTKDSKSKAKKVVGSVSSSVRKTDSSKVVPKKAKDVPSISTSPTRKDSSTTSKSQTEPRPSTKDPHAPTTTRLHVSGLNPEVTEAELRARFTSFGEVLAVDGWPAGTNALGVPITYAFLTLRTTQGKLARCLSILNNSAWKGSKLRIGEARPLYKDRLSKEAEQTVQSGWKAPTREETEAKFRLVEGGKTLSLDEVRTRPPPESSPIAAGGKKALAEEDSEDNESSSDSESESDSDSDEDDDSDEEEDEDVSVPLPGVTKDAAEVDVPEKEVEAEAETIADEESEAEAEDEDLEDAVVNGGHNANVEADGDGGDDDVELDASSPPIAPTTVEPERSQIRSRVQFNSLEQMFRVRADLDDEAEANNFNLALDEDELADVEAQDQAQTQAGPSFSILGGLVLDDVEMDEDFAFGQVEGGLEADFRAPDGVHARLQEAAQASTATRSESRAAFPFLFPRFEGSSKNSMEPVRDERNPAYRLLFCDLSEGVSPRSAMVPPFRRTETMDEIEEKWKATRRDLTQEYKRRHREAVKKQRRRVVGSRATGGVVGMRATTRPTTRS